MMMNEEKLTESFIDHEVRIRMQEKKYDHLRQEVKDVHNLVRWIFATVIISIIIPIGLKYFNLS